MITADDIDGVDEGTARRIIALGRSIAPCITTLTDDARTDAIAILQGVAREAATRGSRSVKSQRVGPASVEYFDVASLFSNDDRAALVALCGVVPASSSPLGSFPAPSGYVHDAWPEYYPTT